MNTTKLSSVFNGVKTSLIKHSPEILTAIGITGMITGTIMAVKSTPKALDIMDDIRKNEAGKDKKEIGKEIVTKVGPVYLPAIATTVLSAGCLICATSVNNRRNAALATAYSLSETALKEYQAKVVDTIGPKKEQAIRDSIDEDHIKKNPVSNCEVIVTERGNTLCYDSFSGRYFSSDIETIRAIENRLNKRLISETYISLNELYYELGLRCNEQGNELGFNVNDGFIEFTFSSQLADDGRPCLVLNYRVEPRFGYGDLH